MAEEAKKSRGAWFREMKSELKKVTWPNQKTVVKNTGTVLLCSLLIGACIWIFDFVMVTAVQMILSLFA
jgi:preprotein translocase subunit SecE